METKFRIGVSSDNLKADGKPAYGDGPLAILNDPNVEWEFLPKGNPEITPDIAARFDAVCLSVSKVTRDTFSRPDCRLKMVARFGVGYDRIDVPACTENGVMLTITPDGVRRPVATNALTFMLVLAQKLMAKHELTRNGRWNERLNHMGSGLTGKVLGVIGVGNIGAELFRLAKPLDMQFLGHDPYVKQDQVASLGVKLVDKDTLLREADFVSIHCPLTEDTRKLISTRELNLMKPTAYLINTARGPIVDEKALYQALVSNQIAGAALDVFEEEPTPPNNPILRLDNVVVTPHHFCYTDECARTIASNAFQSMVDVANHRTPKHIVNRAALDHPNLRTWLGRHA